MIQITVDIVLVSIYTWSKLNRRQTHDTITRSMKIETSKIYTFLCSTLIILFLGIGQSFGQTGTISGEVIDTNTDSALTGVNVGLIDTRLGAATGNSGQFTISNVPEGSYTIRASIVGYKTVEREIQVQSDETTELAIALSQKSVDLGSISVTGQRSGYMISEISSVTKIGVPLLETPQSVSVITGQQLVNQFPDHGVAVGRLQFAQRVADRVAGRV